MKQHDESKDLNLLRRKCNIDYDRKLISAAKSTILGNSSWGRIDFLTHYCGWIFIWSNDVIVNKNNYNNQSKKKTIREAKKESKQHHLTNKNKNNKSMKNNSIWNL